MVVAWLAGQSFMALSCLYSLVLSVVQTGLKLTEIFQPYLWGALLYQAFFFWYQGWHLESGAWYVMCLLKDKEI